MYSLLVIFYKKPICLPNGNQFCCIQIQIVDTEDTFEGVDLQLTVDNYGPHQGDQWCWARTTLGGIKWIENKVNTAGGSTVLDENNFGLHKNWE